MGALSIWHWLIVLAVVLLLFGSKKLPDAARGLGRSMRIFKSEIKEMQNDDKPAEDQEPQALTQGQPNAAQYAQPQANQYQPQAPQQYQPQAPQQYQAQGQQQGQAPAQGYPQTPQQPYQQPAPQQGQQQFIDPTAPHHGGQGQQGQ
ncbi:MULTISPECIES: Sec-independent protein translocase subunit TatA [Dietzia]|uniref:Sec-independent protein translocase subunit TatA n=1 Tax=Dietzia TaxID=37914 RepID=UPI000D0883D8|nr:MULTISPECIES: Sec-independent protein translocase subunit TatA [Dietzia]AVM65260.1 twin-arginine translocase TatA/TatE family subunit [Dietzia sp. oral taxon 368]MCT1713129.1 Sec-independent protein translocase subunit TatA [Dietzia cinnamea]MCT2263166.1 Sec-independent protein translocase subunit TatA [Dietzia cinnamea]MCT2274783.1 Sec-independent protein translocase subunit TatA [Dietzia cinnamea]